MYLTTKQLATKLKVHTETIRRWVRSGEIPVHKVGTRGNFRFNLDEVIENLN